EGKRLGGRPGCKKLDASGTQHDKIGRRTRRSRIPDYDAKPVKDESTGFAISGDYSRSLFVRLRHCRTKPDEAHAHDPDQAIDRKGHRRNVCEETDDSEGEGQPGEGLRVESGAGHEPGQNQQADTEGERTRVLEDLVQVASTLVGEGDDNVRSR